jgi:hypothetical protein
LNPGGFLKIFGFIRIRRDIVTIYVFDHLLTYDLIKKKM